MYVVRSVYSVSAFTRHSVRGSIAVNPALWRRRLRADPTAVRKCFNPLRVDPFRRRWPRSGRRARTYIYTTTAHVYVGYRAAAIPDLGYCHRNRRDCCGLPIIGPRRYPRSYVRVFRPSRSSHPSSTSRRYRPRSSLFVPPSLFLSYLFRSSHLLPASLALR